MFTIRIESGPERDVRSCARYKLTHEDGERVLYLMDSNGMQEARVVLAKDASAYVMNAQGKTVDTYRPVTTARAAQFRTT